VRFVVQFEIVEMDERGCRHGVFLLERTTINHIQRVR